MAATLLPDVLWNLVEPFLPIPSRRPKGKRPRVSDRACLTGFVFVLRSGFPLADAPAGTRVRVWDDVLAEIALTGNKLVVWDLIHFALLDRARARRPD